MITGTVNREREVVIRLVIRGPGGQQRRVKAVIDTGFNDWLCLPPALIALLGLPVRQLGRGMLADGSETIFNIHEGTVVWDRRRCRILVYSIDSAPLVGMALLDGYEFNVQVRAAGKVTIKRLPGP